MHILTGSDIFNKNFEGSVVTIGNFDGIHRGHGEIFRHLKLQSERLGLPSVVVTFEPHPLAVLAPEAAPALITTYNQKVALIAEAGIDCLTVIEFTAAFSRMTAESFVRDVLCRALGMRHIIIGHDYAFGRERQGNYETLARLGAECGFSLQDIEPVGEGDTIFSSSLARRLISSGDLPAATAILGRYHVISGQVVHGRQIGSKLGFPTANITTRNELIPPDGVYAVMVCVDDTLLQGACSIGTNPTFGEGERTIEVFLLDFSGQLYDRAIAICFVQRLREVRKFFDINDLIRAIEGDIAMTREILSGVNRDLIKPLLDVMPFGS
ncbi:MAG: riboflavin biosynthesis protein RibF [Desulfuromonadales bacterium GWD2_54_10]|nr:MAG: riboflavin biosynthesis protein RibF [Desulfuromonadales bacterium GWD2_54_10]